MNREEAKTIIKIINTCNNEQEWNQIYKNKDYIKAWAKGEKLQFKTLSADWTTGDTNLSFKYLGIQYRIKPEVGKYRIALYSNKPYMVYNDTDATIAKANSSFIKWLSPWIEYDLP